MLNLNNIRLTFFNLTLLIAVSASAARAQERIVKVGIPAINMSVISFSTAMDKGFYRDEGLHVELILMSAAIASRALIAGETHFAAVGGATMPAFIQRAPLLTLLKG